jgi:hypothetical protein
MTEDFESGMGNWVNVTGEDTHERRWDFNGTASRRTGPGSGANASIWYMYVETSKWHANDNGDTAILEGPEINGVDCLLSFYYHMYGSNIGALSVDVYSQATVDLSSYSGTIKVRFHCTAAGGWRGDMAIDDIEITGSNYRRIRPVL